MDQFDGFREFVLSRGPALSRTAFLLTGSHHAAEELLQEALAKTAGRWSKLAGDGNPEAYVRRIMVNDHTSWWRRRRREVQVSDVPDRSCPDRSAELPDRLMLAAALATLPPRQRAVVVLRFYDDLGVHETAAALGCSTGTVKSQTADALARLRLRLPVSIDENAGVAG